AKTGMTKTCKIQPLGPVITSQVQVWNVCYAESNSDGSYTSKVVTSQPYVDPTGVGLAFDTAGSPSIAYTGEGAMPSMDRCGANEVFLTTSQGGKFGTPVQVSHGSQSNDLVPNQKDNCVQNVCNTGDTTGLWPSLGFDRANNALIAFRDVHFGFANDDFG